MQQQEMRADFDGEDDLGIVTVLPPVFGTGIVCTASRYSVELHLHHHNYHRHWSHHVPDDVHDCIHV